MLFILFCSIYRLCCSSLFFFFNDTATTEIYTLSLHDALPISGARPARLAPGRGETELDRVAPGDRKSTRLNSSHVSISYAVFCLKKKSSQDDTIDLETIVEPNELPLISAHRASNKSIIGSHSLLMLLRFLAEINQPFFFLMIRPPPSSTLFPYTTLFRSTCQGPTSCSRRWWSRSRCSCWPTTSPRRSEEHTSELQSRFDLVCRLVLEKKKDNRHSPFRTGQGCFSTFLVEPG